MSRELSIIGAHALVYLLAAASASAATEYTLTTDTGLHLVGGTVCFYRITGTPGNVSPGAYWFTGKKEVRCLPSDTLLDLPVGMFHFFGTHPGGFITAMRQTLESTELAPVDSYKRVDLEVVPAGTLDFARARPLIQPSDYFGVWINDTERYPGFFVPALGDANDIMIPARRDVVPLIISGGTPRFIGNVIRVEAGQRRMAEFLPPLNGTGDLLSWIETDNQYIKHTVRHAAALSRLTAYAENSGQRFDSIVPVFHVSNLLGTLQIFKNVPVGATTLRIAGRTWETDELLTSVVPGVVTMTSKGLYTVPAGSITAHYTPPSGVVPIEAAQTQVCPREDANRHGSGATIRFTLYKCQQPKHGNPQKLDVSDCVERTVREQALSNLAPVEFTGVPGGNYVIEAYNATLGRQRHYAYVAPTDSVEVNLDAVAVPIFGRVTRLGKPVGNTKIIFHEDTPNRGVAVTNEQGEFAAFVLADPAMWPTNVVACDESFRFTYMATEPRQPSAPYNIEIPANSLVVTVSDAATSKPLRDARARYAITDDEAESVVHYSETGIADAEGRVKFENIAPRRPIHVCARHRGFRQACAPIMVLKDDEEQSINLRLSRSESKIGRVTGLSIDIGKVFWVREVTGIVTEISLIALGADGVFECTLDHSAAEYAVIASTNQPLVVVAPNNIRLGEEISIEVPPIAVLRSFAVSLSTDDGERQWVTLSIGGRVLPLDAFAFHMNNRHQSAMVSKTSPLQVSEIAQSGPIVVHVVSPKQLSPTEKRFRDLFSLPEYSRLIRHKGLPDGATTVVFP
jgi:hypothetical protein